MLERALLSEEPACAASFSARIRLFVVVSGDATPDRTFAMNRSFIVGSFLALLLRTGMMRSQGHYQDDPRSSERPAADAQGVEGGMAGSWV